MEGRGEAGETGPSGNIRATSSARLALGVFVAYLIVAFFVIMFIFGRGHWFFGDEWGFIVGRSLRDVGGLFEPQNNHWSTVPIVVYQVLFQIFGLNSYLPYMGCTVALHLALAALLRVVMRRAGVRPWVATVVAGAFVLFGTGEQNILLGVQISMVGSMVLGITHLLMADHDGPANRRDALGLAAGALSLMASGVGLPMVAIVGLAVLIRRGWALAIYHTLPLALLYGGWLFWQRSNISGKPRAPASVLVQWVVNAEEGTFLALGQLHVVAIALAVLLVVGLLLAWARLGRAELRRQAAAPVALLAGGVLLMALVASQRFLIGADAATSSRYVAMLAAMTLPALGVAAEALIRQWRLAAPLVVGLFLAGVPGNIAAFPGTDDTRGRAFFETQRAFFLGAAYSPVASLVPRGVHPDPGEFAGDSVTVGFLLSAWADGKVPAPPVLTAAQQERVDTRLIVSQSTKSVTAPAAACATHEDPLVLQPRLGQQFVISGRVAIARRVGPDKYTMPTIYTTVFSGRVLTVELPHQGLRVEPVAPAGSFTWCTVA